MKSNLRPFSISYYLTILLLLLMLSIGLTMLVSPSLNNVPWAYNTFEALGYYIITDTNEQVFDAALNSQISLFDLGLCSSVFIFFLLAVAALKLRTLINKNSAPDYCHSHGPKLLEFSEAIRDASRKLKKEPGKPSIKLHPSLKITDQLEQGNIFAFGQQGGGKSTFIKPIAKQVYAYDCYSFTHDEKGEYQSDLQREETVCLELTECADYVWEISRDLKSVNDAALVAKAMLEEGNENDRFFIDSARQVLKGVIIDLQKNNHHWSWKELNESLFSSSTKLKQTLANSYPPAAELIEQDSKTTQSIRSLLSSRLFWLGEMAELQKSAKHSWSISTLLSTSNTKNHVFFKPNNANPEFSRSVCNTLITLLIERWLIRKDSNQNKFWLILDELGNFPKNPSLIRWLTLSRSKGGRTIAGTQNLSQLYEIYGTNITETILSLFRTVVIMRLGASGPSAQKASELLGQQRVVTFNQNLSVDNKLSLSTQFHDRPVVCKEDIINLPSANHNGVVGFLQIGGLTNVYKLNWPFIKAPKSTIKKPIPLQSTLDNSPVLEKKPVNRLNKRTASHVNNCEGEKL